MSHVKNVEAFGELVGICTGLGGKYNPGQSNLREESITALLATARTVLTHVQDAYKDVAVATNLREVAFDNMRGLAGRVISELKSSGVLEQTLADARALNRKLRGYRMPRDPVAGAEVQEPEAKKSRRARGTDFVTQAESFEMLVKLVKAEPKYSPGIEELTIASLEAVHASLEAHTTAVTNARVLLDNARRERNDQLYRISGSMAEIATAMKYQLKAVFGYHGEACKKVSRIQIIKPSIG